MFDLSNLPSPAVIEQLDYEALVQLLKDDVKARFQALGIDWDVDVLETDPVVIVIEAFAYRELLLRNRVNDAARANLLYYALTSDLDHLGAFYDVTRLSGESDNSLRSRVLLTIIGRSAGGPAERYEAVARSVSTRVRDVAIWREGRDPTVHVAVLSTEVDGVADAALLADVQDALESPDIQVVSDRFDVVSAVSQTVDVTIEVRLAPEARQALLAELPVLIKAAWAEEDLLGLDLTTSWLTAKAMQPGVSRAEVTSPVADIVVSPNEAVALGTITIVDGGRGR